MKSRKLLLKKSLVYLILDRPTFSKFSLKKISCLVANKKIGIIQLRDKISSKAQVAKFAIGLGKILAPTQTLFIINDYVDLVESTLADGVHLGQGDYSLKQARKILGNDKLIGVSCQNLAQALKAQQDGADYLGIGPLYTSAIKPLQAGVGLGAAVALKTKIKIPYFAIGNINESNIHRLTEQGIRRIAVCRAILKSPAPKQAAQRLYKKLKSI